MAKTKERSLSYLEISKDNLIHNIKQFKGLVKGKTKIAIVIKANAYGHGDMEVAKIANPYVDYFQVDSIEEAERVRKVSKKPILIFGYTNEDGVKRAIEIGAIISAFDLIHLLKINHVAEISKKKTKVHLAIDSYLGREGIMPSQVENIIKEIKILKNIVLDGVYSHFANIEDTMNSTHANRQIDTYHKCVEIFRENGYPNINTHISATSGILVYEKGENLHNIVRLGIGLYGLWPSEHLEYLNKKKINLKPVLKWITHVAQVKVIPANYPIGYGLTYITKKATKIAIIPQGYYDGLTRSMSNNGEFLIRGKKVKIIGRVAMNMIVVDVSHVKDVRADDEVVIIGIQDKAKITAEDVAKRMDTINYEVTTKISALLPRIIR
ncbi:alanine racemase [Candidatus Nomurabacteria bacterium RIFOXYC2_FULL_36_8]|nr:MAG: alanine racemase [Candidatus Nomurabacteria bacterium GW2011_GWE2_36_115]KKP93448.1 MAG: alanine racemase [Candidatus Nomurabacteria bacterium GW2011_GWF2_36_126]KKP96566.1 MAG: alanine racemase [Candidatus Nomurabacteria bacterium GW2011_GWD2_36_14]KKP99829.1 MAG: alanine racemase [Candidatus Nomurabacteria bacterium GW2011_GWF2_36_19]KKQ05131.1 MAG: alanine racemase [Candidatus Nomurabacteria bacterium GW2011_GWF1_36_47]KKQ09266.1 MAG: alanine racemase [Candidatus Nomurabacteria bact